MTEPQAASRGDVIANPALSPDHLTWEDEPRAAPSRDDGVSVLRIAGVEGPLDWVLEQARAGRIDLARLPVLALVEQCVAAVTAVLALRKDAGAAGNGPEPASASLPRLGEWLIMAAWLVWLRSRLLLPADDPEARAAREEAEALWRQPADRARVQAMAAALDSLPQLGRNVFARHGSVPPFGPAPVERTADLSALLATCARLLGSRLPSAAAEVYRPAPPLLWRVPHALARIQRLLPAVLSADAVSPPGASLWCFLSAAEDLERPVAARPDRALDQTVLGRSAVASTFVAGLEIARQGQLTLAQEEAFGTIRVRRRWRRCRLHPATLIGCRQPGALRQHSAARLFVARDEPACCQPYTGT